MRTIAIKLCDSDFCNTFRPLLETVYRAYLYHKGAEPLNEATIREMVINGIEYHYLYWQAFNRQHGDPSPSSSMEYLRNKVKVFVDDEAEKVIQTTNDGGGSWYLELQTGIIYSF